MLFTILSVVNFEKETISLLFCKGSAPFSGDEKPGVIISNGLHSWNTSKITDMQFMPPLTTSILKNTDWYNRFLILKNEWKEAIEIHVLVWTLNNGWSAVVLIKLRTFLNRWTRRYDFDPRRLRVGGRRTGGIFLEYTRVQFAPSEHRCDEVLAGWEISLLRRILDMKKFKSRVTLSTTYM